MSEDARRPPLASRRFEVVRTLGSGGMGVVYEALDRERGARVALKTLRTLDGEARVRLKNEFRALSDIHHPNLVSLGELQEEDGQLYFTMELVEGEDFVEHVRPRSGEDRPAVELRRVRDLATLDPTPRAGQGASEDRGPASWHWLARRGERFDEARLRDAFRQLAVGIHALHAAQKIHRDIKPSNVLVTPEGRVVILDFGLVMDVARGHRDRAVVGTAHFMAPEQAAAEAVGPEADWYSMGAMLYVALTGFYPFQLAPEVALDFKQQVEPTPPSVLVEHELPADLESLCVELLRRDPAARPSGAEVLRRLHVEPDDGAPPPSATAAAFVGRWRELGQLDQALADMRAGEPVAVLVEGESGMGKSALVRRFLDQFAGDAVILAGRCYEREWVPYKAVDEVMEALGRHLAELPEGEVEALLPPNAALLADLFPALRKVAAIAGAPRPSRTPSDAPGRSSRPSRPSSSGGMRDSGRRDAALRDLREPLEPHEARERVFAALRELLRRLGAATPLVVAVDDLQWADADGLSLLAEVLRPPDAPVLLFLGTARAAEPLSTHLPEPTAGPPSRGAARASRRKGAEDLAAELGAVRRIALGDLPADEARQLVRLLMRAAGARPDALSAADLDALVEEAGGHPLFLDALVRHRLARAEGYRPVKLEEALWARIQRLDAPARRVLETVAIAGGPIAAAIAGQAAAIDRDDLPRTLSLLRAQNLVSTTGAGQGESLLPFHDRVRETVVGRLDAPARRALHLRLGLALEAAGAEELEALTVHFREAGDIERAAGYAARAGDQAAGALAFDRAAELYRTARGFHPSDRAERRDLLIKLGDALGNAGRGVEAAEAYQSASRAADRTLALELRRRAAENLLRSGRVEEGTAELEAVLSAVDLDAPRSPTGKVASLLFRRAQLRLRGLSFTERSPEQIPPETLTRIDACWSAALALGLVDTVRGAAFQARHLLLALDAGDPYRVTRALAIEVGFLATAGGSSRPRVVEVLAATVAVARRTGDPHAQGFVESATGFSLFFIGRFREALAALDRAEMIFREQCVGAVWERGLTIAYAVWTLWFLGDAAELARRVPRHVREAEARGDRFVTMSLRANVANAVWLFADDPRRAAREAEEAGSTVTLTPFDPGRAFDLVARASIHLYEGDGAAAHRRVAEQWPALDRSFVLQVQLVNVSLRWLRARAALAAARAGKERTALLNEAERDARAIEGECMPWADPLAALIRAGVAASKGDPRAAASWLTRALRGLRAAEMALCLAATERRLGELTGGEEGAAQIAAADAWMTAQGIKNPPRLTAMLAPGFDP